MPFRDVFISEPDATLSELDAVSVGPVTVPVNVGDAIGAFAESAESRPLIFDVAMAAVPDTSASTIVPSAIFAEVTEPSASFAVVIEPSAGVTEPQPVA